MGRCSIAAGKDRAGTRSIYTSWAHGRRSATPPAAAQGPRERPVSTRIYRAAWLSWRCRYLSPLSASGDPTRSRHPAFSRSSTEAPPSSSPRSSRTSSPTARREPSAMLRHPGRATTPSLRLRRRASPDPADTPVGTWSWSTSWPWRRRPGRRTRSRTVPASPWPTATTSGCHRVRTTTPRGPGRSLELARDLGNASLSHPIVLVSTDGGAYGGLGAAHFAETRRFAGRIAALVNLDAIGSGGSPRLEFAGDTSPAPSRPCSPRRTRPSSPKPRSRRNGRARSRSSSTWRSRSASTSRRRSSRGACPRSRSRPATVARARPLATRCKPRRGADRRLGRAAQCSSARSTSRPRSRPGRSPTSTSGRAFSTAGRSNSRWSRR